MIKAQEALLWLKKITNHPLSGWFDEAPSEGG
jgi:hypothetical protein